MAENFNKGINKFPQYESIPVAVSAFLPYKNKKGELIHVFYLKGKNKFYCSQEFFERLINEYPNELHTTEHGFAGQG